MKEFLEESKYVDYSNYLIKEKAKELFNEDMSDVEKAKAAFEFVRDKIIHSFDCNATVITSKASDVLKYKTGICHAKANLLAALLRSQNIPTGFCFQHITLLHDDSKGYCLHGFNAVYLNGKWIKLDPRGNKSGINAKFSIEIPMLAFENRAEYNEYYFDGIYAAPDIKTMEMLDKAKNLKEVAEGLPDIPYDKPTIILN